MTASVDDIPPPERCAAPTTEATPLLRPVSEPQDAADASPPRRQLLRIVLPLVFILGVVEIAAVCIQAGMAALVEGSLCQRAFDDVQDPYGDPRCKDAGIQADLAWILGMENTISVIPGLFVAIPYAVMADRYGPNYVMGLVWVGQFLSEAGHLIVCLNPQIFDVRWIYASSIMTAIGGGGVCYSATRFLVGASLVSEKNRTTIFFYMQAYGNVMTLLGGSVGFFVMDRAGPVYTQAFGVLLLFSMIIPGFALPRKLSNTPAVSASTSSESIQSRFRDVMQSTLATLRIVFGRSLQLTLLLTGLVFTTLGAYEATFRLQYATKRFHWSWAQASLLASVTAASNLAMLVAVLPLLGWLMLRRDFSALAKDLWFARGSVAVQVLGSFATALAPTGGAYVAAIAFYECNKGYMSSMASIIVSVARKAGIAQEATMFACVSLAGAVGQILAGPVMAEAFQVGLRWGREWYGLPFVAAGTLQFLTLCILVYVKQK